jgi:prevent-host-death family protein
MYNLYMNTIPSTQVRQKWAETVIAAKEEPVVVTDHGRPTVAVMDYELAKLALLALEESQDIEDANRELVQYREDGIAFTTEEVAAELGITLD